jgi:hypothetical protein
MANLSFTTNNQIIRDLYDTPQEAFEASKALGCDGYRTYIINGDTKYVPCASYIQYENALRYRTVQGKIGAFGNETFGDKLVGLQFANAKDEIQGDPFFTLGNFSINKSVRQSPNSLRQQVLQINQQSIQNDAVTSYTVDSIARQNLPFFEGKDYVTALKNRINENITVDVLFDKKKLDKYVLFSSLKDRIKNTLVEIYNNYPAALKCEAISIINPTISNYINYPLENRSEFTVNLYSIFNPFQIEYVTSGSTIEDSEIITKYRNFTKTFKDYVVYYNGVEYPIINVLTPSSYDDETNGLQLIINGSPFNGIINNNNEANVTFFIKPKETIIIDFFDNLSDLGKFLLNKDIETNTYISEFIYPTLSESGKIVEIKEVVSFPIYDTINIDMFTSNFDDYTTKLNDLAQSYDSVKTNLISRFLTTDSLKEFDTSDRKVNLIFQLYGKTFDDIKKYIDGITFMRNVSYDKIENIPDLLIKNYATMLGLETYNIEDEKTLVESLFNYNTELTKGTTPAELDIELWRRILINSSYLYKSKGTRKSIEFILRLVGIPDEIFELNEYIYLAEKKLDAIDTLNKIYQNSTTDDPNILLQKMPFDSDGYPTVPLSIKYQENGSFINENKKNIGLFDFGQSYINEFKKFDSVFLFDVYRTIDNVKSWVYNNTAVDRLYDDTNSYTEYESLDTRLTINSKEFEVYLSLNRIFDVTVYRQYFRNIGIVNSDLNISKKFNATETTFNQFLKKSLDVFINPTNRKTIKTYPSLSKIYFDYLKTTTTPIDSMRSLEFLNKFDSSWVKLVEQFVPSTTIVNAGKKIQNSTFLDNKHKYLHGKNSDVSWLGTDGSEFQQKALKPVYAGQTNVIENKGKQKPSILGESVSFEVTGKQSPKVFGTDPTINEYFGVHYTMFEYCDESEGRYYIWEPGVNYADPIYGGNINATTYDSTSFRYGVFTVYNDKLYRLNTRLIFTGVTNINTTGITESQPPNIATKTAGGVIVSGVTVGGVTKKIWDHIPYNTDSTIAYFQDSSGQTLYSEEKSFYLNTIGRALAYIRIGIDFDCPPPRPHVCYFDTTGKTLNITYNTYTTYVDETGISRAIKQPKFYGFSKDVLTTKPSGVIYGTQKNWANDYKKIHDWVTGQTYYFGEIITKVDPINKERIVSGSSIYIVTGGSYTANITFPTGTTTPIGLGLITTGTTQGLPAITTNMNNGIPTSNIGGLYGRYEDRTKSDPLMHIDPAYINKLVLNPNSNFFTINLSKSIGLSHIFLGDTPQATYVVRDNLVNNELFVSDSISLEFDGFYPINRDNIGPSYEVQTDDILTHTLEERVDLRPDTNNYISIQSLNENFVTSSNDLALTSTNPGYYLVIKDSFLTFNFTLYFETLNNLRQIVDVKLLDANQNVYDTQRFTFNGDDDSDDRQFNFNYGGFFKSGEKIYLAVNPVATTCSLSRYEILNYSHIDLVDEDYEQLDDPRFRVLFNNGFVSKNSYFDGFSIKPIYNSQDLDTNNLITASSLQVFNNIPLLNIQYSQDPSYIINKLYNNYYTKNTNTDVIYDKTLYDKALNYDKIDFTFKIRSKNGNLVGNMIPVSGSTIGQNVGFDSTDVEFEFTFNDYFLGASPRQTQNNNATNAISIGKNIRKRRNIHNHTLNYIPRFSYYNGINLGAELNLTQNAFKSYDDGVIDYAEFDYSFDLITQIRDKKRYVINNPSIANFGIFKLENEIYESEIYQTILDRVPLFNERITNYGINDVVKVPINNYKLVVDTPTGRTIEIKTIYKLYICINDIHEFHCYRLSGIKGVIHEIYRPRGARSCFIEIEKYNPTNFDPWGYEDLPLLSLNNANVIDYINKTILPLTSTGTTQYNYGDIFRYNFSGNDEYFKFTYPKPLLWDSNRQYYRGDFILVGADESTPGLPHYRFYFAVIDNKGQNPLSSPNWTKITQDSDLFSHKSLLVTEGMVSGVTSYGASWLSALDIFSSFTTTVVKLPKTLPVNTDGDPLIATGSTYKGITFNNRWNNILKPAHSFIDTAYATDDTIEIYNINKILKSASGDTISTSMPFIYKGALTKLDGGSGYVNNLPYTYENDNYSYNEVSYVDKTNLYLKPAFPITLAQGIYVYPFLTESSNTYPLFQRLGRITEKNNPNLFLPGASTGATYDKTSLYLGNKYAVNRGVLYQYIGTNPLSTTSGTTQPYLDRTNWLEKDFCLANNFTFYKDRVKVSVYESDIISLNDTIKNSLYLFENNLTLKNGFNNRYFSGTTINNRLITALDKFYDITDENRVLNIRTFGQVDFRRVGSDLFMDYYYEKDELNFPLTGEFLGKLKVSNPCGQTAVSIFGVLFDVNVDLLDRQKGIGITPILAPQTTNILPYVVRVVVSQRGNSNANITLTTNDTNRISQNKEYVVTRSSTFDNSIEVIPQNSMTFKISYDTANNQNIFTTSSLDDLPLFINNTVIDNNIVLTKIERNGSIETRTILVKNITENKTIFFNLTSLTRATVDVTNTSVSYDVRAINVKNSL